MASTPTGEDGRRRGSRSRREPFDGVVLDPDGRRIGLGSLVRGESGAPDWLELPRFLSDVVKLVWSVVKDPRVGRWQKVAAGAAIAYVASPLDVVPDMIPGLGQLDDLFVVRQALRMLANAAGTEVLREHWSGTEEGFALVMRVAGVTA